MTKCAEYASVGRFLGKYHYSASVKLLCFRTAMRLRYFYRSFP